MHILILADEYKSRQKKKNDGLKEKEEIEIYIEKQIKFFLQQSYQITIMSKYKCWGMSLHQKWADSELLRLLWGFRSLYCLFYLLRRRKIIDILYVFNQSLYSLIAILAGRILKIPVVYIAVVSGETFKSITFDNNFGKDKPCRRFHDYVLKKSNIFIAGSKNIWKEFIAHGIEKEKICVIPQGIDLEIFTPLSLDNKRKLKEKLQIPLEAPIVLFYECLSKRKGIDILLEAWPVFRLENADAYLIIIGSGIKKYVNKIHDICSVDKKIIYMEAVNQPQYYFQCADVFLALSRCESSSNILMEAMACGCVVVATRIDGRKELVENNKNGMVFDEDNVMAFVDALHKLINNKNKISIFSKASIKKCKTTFDINVVMEKVVYMFKGLKRSQKK